MTFFSRPNFVSATVTQLDDPAAIAESLDPFPKWTKKRWGEWLKQEDTEHHLLSMCEGVNRNQIVTRENEVCTVYGLLVDFDKCKKLDENIQPPEGLSEDLYPTFIARTFSGGFRFVYVFERPINVLRNLYPKFARAAAEALMVKRYYIGEVDEKTLYDPGQYYEIGREWVKSGGRVPWGNVTAWMGKVAKRYDWSSEGLKIPIETVREKLEEKYPGKWPGGWDRFDVGKRGTRFWDDTADNPEAAWVTETGIYCHTGMRKFYGWNDPVLLGGWATQYAEAQLGEAVKDVYFDGKKYWKTNPAGAWVSVNKGDMEDHLAETGLSVTPQKGELVAGVTAALNKARDINRIVGAVPKLYYPTGHFNEGARRFLNISWVRPLPPAAGPTKWGGGFPWLANYLTDVFAGDEGRDLERILGWLRHAYTGAVSQNFERGLALILAGPTEIGKNFFNKGIVGGLLGHSMPAESYLVGGDQYNDKLMECPHWRLDDAAVRNRTEFSTILKRVVANDELPYRPMYASATSREWLGRVVITCNDDAEGLSVLPRTDLHILDKLLILRGYAPRVIGKRYPSDPELVNGELPHLAAYLLHTETPTEFVGGSRFGVAKYADPELLDEARSASPPNQVLEILEMWRQSLTENWGPKSASELYSELVGDNLECPTRDLTKGAVRNARSLGMQVKSLVDAGVDWIKIEVGAKGGRNKVYRIEKP